MPPLKFQINLPPCAVARAFAGLDYNITDSFNTMLQIQSTRKS
jgi:hypothetical protein